LVRRVIRARFYVEPIGKFGPNGKRVCSTHPFATSETALTLELENVWPGALVLDTVIVPSALDV
jgi:hypothetical protein